MNEILDYQQGTDVALPPDGFEQVTNPLGPPKRTASRFSHFPDDVYDLSSETHLARFLKVLLGDAGVSQLHKRNLLARLQQSLGGVNFFDLDAFYGAVFGVRRRATELLPKDPIADHLTPTEWDQVRIRDGSYRSRIEQYAKALNLGATARGIESTAEALLGCQCDVMESWRLDDRVTQTWGGVEATYATWGAMDGKAWGELEKSTYRPFSQRHIIWVYPHRKLTVEEQFSVQFSLDRIRPAGALVIVQPPVEDSYTDVPIARVASDSEHWEVRSSVRNTLVNGTTLLFDGAQDAIVPVSPPPFGSYQGEAWTLMVNNPAILAYQTDGDVSIDDMIDPLAQDVVPERVRVNDQEISFGPSNAVRPLQATLAGRSVSDGVLACNPHTGWNSRTPPVSPTGTAFRMIDFGDNFDPSLPADLFVDGIALSDLTSVITRDQAGRSAPLFWSSPVRPPDSPANEILEIRFESESEFNNLSYEIAAFPQTVEVQAWVTGTGKWVTVHTQQHYGSNPGGITGAIPPGYVHPYHYGNEHWVKIRVAVEPVMTGRVRFVLKRSQYGTPPVGYDGNPVGYPLGLRHIDVGYRLSSSERIPNIDLSQPVATTANMLGQPVINSIERYSADRTIDATESYWKCEAQPISQAVVNLYVDVSDSKGNPAVFDRIFIDPYTSGPTINLYWSDQAPESTQLGEAASREKPIIPSLVRGSLTALLEGDRGIRWPDAAPAWFDFANTDLGFDPTKAWWWATEFYPNFTLTTIPDRATLLSSGTEQDGVNYGDISVVFNSAGGFTFRFYGLTLTNTAWSWTPGQKIKLAGKWDPTTKTISLLVTNQNGSYNLVTGGSGTYTAPTTSPSSVRVGRSVGSSSSNDVSLDVTMIRFVMGYGDHDLFAVTQGETLESYTLKPRYQSTWIDRTAGTFLRYHPEYFGWKSDDGGSFGWMGGHVDMWSNVTWAPIAQDFTLAKGYIRTPIVRARFLKLEFTNLAAEPFETFLSHSKQVKIFSKANTTLPPSTGRSIASEPQPLPSTSTAISDRFTTAGVTLSPFERRIASGVDDVYRLLPSPTAGLIVSDPVAAARLAEFAGFGFDLMRWQPALMPAQFTERSVHVYDTVVLNHTSKVAFFAGVRDLKISRSNNLTPLDTAAYVDPFYDMASIESYTSDYDPGIFHSPASPAPGVLVTPQNVVSKTMMSMSPVTDLQFATQQTPPQQIIPDDQFRDTALATSTFSNPEGWHSYGDGRVLWDSTRQGVLVTRNPASVISYVELDTPFIHRPITPVFSARPTVISVISSNATGGIESPAVAVSKGGMINVAARLTPVSELAAPLYIQLFGSDGTTLLAEQAVTSQANVQVEAVMPYVLGSNPLVETTVTVRVIQKGPFRDEWMMNTLSLYDDGMLWEFSIDGGTEWVPGLAVRNNYAGVVNFPNESNSVKWRCTFYRQSVGINTIDIRPWYKGKIQGA